MPTTREKVKVALLNMTGGGMTNFFPFEETQSDTFNRVRLCAELILARVAAASAAL